MDSAARKASGKELSVARFTDCCMEFSVREAVTDDARAIRDVHLASIEGLAGQEYTEEQVSAWAHERNPRDYPIESEETYFLVAEYDGQIVGFGWMKPEADDYFSVDVDGELTATYIYPSIARSGVGTQIYDELEEYALRNDVKSLGLWASLNAISFYETQGYEPITEHTLEYEGVELAVVEMEKRPLR
jgi:putative acetyltransferase